MTVDNESIEKRWRQMPLVSLDKEERQYDPADYEPDAHKIINRILLERWEELKTWRATQHLPPAPLERWEELKTWRAAQPLPPVPQVARKRRGIGRLVYFLGLLAFAVLRSVLLAEGTGICGIGRLGYFFGHFFGLLASGVLLAEGTGTCGILFLLLLLLILTVIRLRNIGMSGWWSLLIFVPIASAFVVIMCLAYPEGYQDTKKRDAAGKIIVWISICLLGILLLGLIIGILGGF